MERLPEPSAFDIIGDVHGCFDELVALLGRLGYQVGSEGEGFALETPVGRRAIFLGDLVNRGPNVAGVLRLAMTLAEAGQALCLRGNHDEYLAAKIRGRDVVSEFGLTSDHNVVASIAQLNDGGSDYVRRCAVFIESRPSQLTLDEGRLAVAHAGLPAEYQGVVSDEAERFAVHGLRPNETLDTGRLGRPWQESYRGAPFVVYGHYAGEGVRWANNTVCLDTGCVYGGSLTALRYPEREIVSVPAQRVYYERRRRN